MSNYTDVNSNKALHEELERMRADLEVLIRGGRWLVWSCTVTGPHDDQWRWHWHFQRNSFQVLPPWFDVEGLEVDGMVLLDRVRLPEDNPQCDRIAHQALDSGASGYSQMFRVRLRDGRISWIEENVAIHIMPDGKRQLIGVCIDATERKKAEERMQSLQEELIVQQEELIQQNEELQELRKMLEQDKLALAEANALLADLAITDGLTGIKNHRFFQEQLENEWQSAGRYGTPLSLVLLDLDHFKQFNDAFGHPAGDEVLKAVGQALREATRASDCIARYGGEEFAVILPRTDSGGAAALAERVRSGIETQDWKHRKVTASIGVTTRSPLTASPQALIREADRALYQAKSTGRNRVCLAPDTSIKSRGGRLAA